MINVGDICPDFELPAAGETTVSLKDYSGRYLVLYFYPRADTPGCTTQAQDFTASLPQLDKLNAGVLGVSKDPVKKLDKFATKRELKIALASDEETDLCEQFGVFKEKSMYGKTYMGIERSTFLVSPDDEIIYAERKVKAKGHADKILDLIQRHANAKGDPNWLEMPS
jgi:peroxiredoxin Q/BCP